jgi:hypothetical protein
VTQITNETEPAQTASSTPWWEHAEDHLVLLSFLVWLFYSVAIVIPVAWYFDIPLSFSMLPKGDSARGMGVVSIVSLTSYVLAGCFAVAAALKFRDMESHPGRDILRLPLTYAACAATFASLPELLQSGYTCCFGCSKYPYLDAEIFARAAEAARHGWISDPVVLWENSTWALVFAMVLGMAVRSSGTRRKVVRAYVMVAASLLVALPVVLASPSVRRLFWYPEVAVHVWQPYISDAVVPLSEPSEIESLSTARIPVSLLGISGEVCGPVKSSSAELKDLRLENGQIVFTKPKWDAEETPVEMTAKVDGKDFSWRVLLVR